MKPQLYYYLAAAIVMIPAYKFYRKFGYRFWPWDDLVIVLILLVISWYLRTVL